MYLTVEMGIIVEKHISITTKIPYNYIAGVHLGQNFVFASDQSYVSEWMFLQSGFITTNELPVLYLLDEEICNTKQIADNIPPEDAVQ